jgi:hypothetical protein
MKYQGSCHCGRVRFEAEGEIDSAMACNCSICQRKGALMWFVPRSAMQLLTPEEDVASYLFNKHRITHRFCAVCGIHPYGEARSPAGAEMAAINIRCIEGIDLEAIPVKHFDGRSV